VWIVNAYTTAVQSRLHPPAVDADGRKSNRRLGSPAVRGKGCSKKADVRPSRSAASSKPTFTVKLLRWRLDIEMPLNSSSSLDPMGYEGTWAPATTAFRKTCGLYELPSIASAIR